MDYLRNLHELHQLEQLIFQKPEAELSGILFFCDLQLVYIQYFQELRI